MSKIIVSHPEKCTGCRYCEIICSFHHEGVVNLRKTRINVIKSGYETSFPVTCTHGYGCALECVDACPEEAIEEKEGVVRIDEDLCTGCGACVDACPFGAIKLFNDKAWKCDLCGGDPRCVKFCSQGAITFEEGNNADKNVMNETKETVEEWRKDYDLLQI
jgi:Fe-S-cluster-containing hydrogenase component 2